MKPDATIIREVGEKVQLNLGFEVSKKALAEGVIEAIVTTSSMDRHNESILTDGIDTDNYLEKNPVVLYGHDYRSLPIAKTLSISKTKNKMKAKFQFAVDELPFAATVFNLIKAGYLNAVSIGGRVLEWSDDYRTIVKMEMVEFSVVPVPANPEAIITQRSFEEAAGKSMEEVEKEFEQFAKNSLLDKEEVIDNNQLHKAISLLKGLVATLEDNLEDYRSSSKEVKTPEEESVAVKKYKLVHSSKAVAIESGKVIRLIKKL